MQPSACHTPPMCRPLREAPDPHHPSLHSPKHAQDLWIDLGLSAKDHTFPGNRFHRGCLEAGAGRHRGDPATRAWRPYAESRENGIHALRHFHASVLLDAEKNIKALAEYLGHSDPGLTPRVYAHLTPSSQEQTRKALTAVFDSAKQCERRLRTRTLRTGDGR